MTGDHARPIVQLSDGGRLEADAVVLALPAPETLRIAEGLLTLAERDALEAMMLNLSQRERLVIFLHYYEGRTTAEIARILEITRSSVRRVRRRAIAKVRAQLERATIARSQDRET